MRLSIVILSTYIIKCRLNGEKFLLIFYTKLIQPDIISFNGLSSIWNSIISRAQQKYHFFRSEFTKRHRFPTWPNGAKTEPSDLVSSQVPYPFSLVAHPSREIVFFWSDVISDRSVGLCHCVEILFNGFIRWNFESNYFKSDYFRKWLTRDSASSIGKSIILRGYLPLALLRVFCVQKDGFGIRAGSG